MTTIDKNFPVSVTEKEKVDIDKVEKFLADFEAIKAISQVKLVGPDGKEIEIPASIFRIFRQLVHYLHNGQAINLVPLNKELTTQEAADLLNVSRPHLITLLEKGEMPFRLVGTHRRVSFADLIAYKRRLDTKRQEGLAELARLSQEYGETD